MRIPLTALAALLAVVSVSGGDSQRTGSTPAPGRHELRVPLGLDLYVPAPASNPMTAAKAALGQRLFFEKRLSADGRTSCATCHRPERSFTDGRPVPVGVFGRLGRRNTPSILNRAYGRSAFWDGRAASLEDQVRLAAGGTGDLGLPIEDSVRNLVADAAYRRAFGAAYGNGSPSADGAIHAIATFVRTQLSGDSGYDRFMHGDRAALTAEEQRGLALFTGEARCARCHSGPLLSDEEFHNTGVSWGKDAGRHEATGVPADLGRFKTPSLRNVARTPPYMHDGSIPDLDAVLRFYEKGGGGNPNLDDDLRLLRLSAADRHALLAFLRALSGERR